MKHFVYALLFVVLGSIALAHAGEALAKKDAVELFDKERMAREELVLRVQKIRSLGADKYGSDEVRVVKVLKNAAKAKIGETLQIYYLSTQNGVPEGECTVYLERYNAAQNDLWKLRGGGAREGVSHVAAPAEAAQPAAAVADYGFIAKIVKISGTKLTLHSFRGHSGFIRDEETDAKTVFERDGKPVQLEDFKPGDWVKISWKENPRRIVKVESTKPLWDEKPRQGQGKKAE